jgi:hypothetical protein
MGLSTTGSLELDTGSSLELDSGGGISLELFGSSGNNGLLVSSEQAIRVAATKAE